MLCDKRSECARFLARYEELGRADLADDYKSQFCHSKAHVACKRREHFQAAAQAPAADLTPTGYSSMLIRLFGE